MGDYYVDVLVVCVRFEKFVDYCRDSDLANVECWIFDMNVKWFLFTLLLPYTAQPFLSTNVWDDHPNHQTLPRTNLTHNKITSFGFPSLIPDHFSLEKGWSPKTDCMYVSAIDMTLTFQIYATCASYSACFNVGSL